MGGHTPGLCKQLLHLHGQSQVKMKRSKQSQWVPLDGISSVGAQRDCRDKSSWDESTKREMAGEDLIPESVIKTDQQGKL